ncbi:MAG: CHAP domain-containing protein [Lachnospiraceae bacterium]|nr:CHAP domain-containing protein [Lachnospiraceae bacterium]
MARTAQSYLDVWRGWRGYSEKNGMHKVIIDLYNSKKPLPRNYKVQYDDEWCDTTVSAAAIKADMVDLIGRECSCERHIEIFKELGIWEEDGTITPKPGYIIVYNWNDGTQPNDGWADHIGVVEEVKNGQITVIEGNRGQAVSDRVISVGNGYIRGYAIPDYEKETDQTPSYSSVLEDIGKLNREVMWTGTVNATELNVRSWPGTENKKLVSYPVIKQGKKVGVCATVRDKDGDPWYFVKISGDKGDKFGFVSAVYITKLAMSKPDELKDDGKITKTVQFKGKVTASSLNVRTWAGTNNAKLKSVPSIKKGEVVEVCDVVNAKDGSRWYYVRIDGKVYGFVHSAYIKAI